MYGKTYIMLHYFYGWYFVVSLGFSWIHLESTLSQWSREWSLLWLYNLIGQGPFKLTTFFFKHFVNILTGLVYILELPSSVTSNLLGF